MQIDHDEPTSNDLKDFLENPPPFDANKFVSRRLSEINERIEDAVKAFDARISAVDNQIAEIKYAVYKFGICFIVFFLMILSKLW